MKKFLISKNRIRSKAKGLSLIELLTSVIIIGIATAGTMELAYVNAFWAANGMNKADNLYAARRFLDTLNRDLRSTISFTYSSAPTITTLALVRSQDLSQQAVDANGFPLSTSPIQIIYTVIPDPNSTDLAATDYLIQRQQGTGSPVTILSGLVGPTSKTGSSPAVFQFSSFGNPTGSTDGLSFSPSGQTNSVVVNLELKRVSFTSATTAMNDTTNHSFEAIRSELFLRNSAFYNASVAP
ncbi:MAG: prepilin-type N-terminal cleavage/methylation domain-containing protein [Candidatus Obscuribacterales bacterium]|nr:prepilin-type N-terminal cleavage/methylation domain-containing protein [Candidatus Obscuribacterales bacterium]